MFARHKDRIKIGHDKELSLVEGREVGLQFFPLSAPVGGLVVQVPNQEGKLNAVAVIEDHIEQMLVNLEIGPQCMRSKKATPPLPAFQAQCILEL